MKQRRRIFALLLVLCLAFALFGCSSSEEPEKKKTDDTSESAKPTQPPETTEPPTEPSTEPRTGHWELYDEEFHQHDNTSISRYDVTQTRHSIRIDYTAEEGVLDDESYSMYFVCECSDMPLKFYPGDTIELRLTADERDNTAPELVKYAEFFGSIERNSLLYFESDRDYSCVFVGTDMTGKRVTHDELVLTCTLPTTRVDDPGYEIFTVQFSSLAGDSYWRYWFVYDD